MVVVADCDPVTLAESLASVVDTVFPVTRAAFSSSVESEAGIIQTLAPTDEHNE